MINKNYIGISRDHSGSMKRLIVPAINDYNQTISSIKKAAIRDGIDTIVTVANCGVGNGKVELDVVNSSIAALRPMKEYRAEGETPLFDSVGLLIETLQRSPDADYPNVSFLVMAITDGCENKSSEYWKRNIGPTIRRLQATDRWTFVFRVPRGSRSELIGLGIPAGNIQEWDQTDTGFREATVQTDSAFQKYYANLSKGKGSSKGFYTDLSGVTEKEVKKAGLVDISGQVEVWFVKDASAGHDIRSFCESNMSIPYRKGCAFYQLVKREDIQAQKLICIRDKKTGAIYSGDAARDLLGLPHGVEVKVSPGDHGKYDIYVQSTSVNRKLPVGTTVLYWSNLPV